MFGLGTQEILIILAVALIIFGPKKLPEIGKAIGQGMRELRKASRDIMDTIDRDVDDEPEPKPAWTPEPVSQQPTEQSFDDTEGEHAGHTQTVDAEQTDDPVTDRTPSQADHERESVQNAADSDRD